MEASRPKYQRSVMLCGLATLLALLSYAQPELTAQQRHRRQAASIRPKKADRTQRPIPKKSDDSPIAVNISPHNQVLANANAEAYCTITVAGKHGTKVRDVTLDYWVLEGGKPKARVPDANPHGIEKTRHSSTFRIIKDVFKQEGDYAVVATVKGPDGKLHRAATLLRVLAAKHFAAGGGAGRDIPASVTVSPSATLFISEPSCFVTISAEHQPDQDLPLLVTFYDMAQLEGNPLDSKSATIGRYEGATTVAIDPDKVLTAERDVLVISSSMQGSSTTSFSVIRADRVMLAPKGWPWWKRPASRPKGTAAPSAGRPGGRPRR
jgi:hypothetical protein